MDLSPLYLTIKVSFVATVITVAAGSVVSWVLARKTFLGKGALNALVMQPLVIPPTVLGYYLLVTLGMGSWFGRFLSSTLGIELVFTWKGAVIAAVISSLPLFIMPSRAAFEGVSIDVENAARLLGKSEFQVLRTITLPLAWRGLLAGAIMAFARATGEFGATLMVAGNIPGRTQTLPIAIYDAVQSGDTAGANTLVLIITVFSFVVIYVTGRFVKGRL
ncbi:MAG: molybdenum ABC transporter permease subunit [Deltaproteobacteria bacterium RIFCSPLOWO2_02_FULL_53_8]|nr:MAG: molybdenum ABC transporter permease subunit [Deltaproteobacteria bacterium RIFCSPLOWO2_02_FULL_53_8]